MRIAVLTFEGFNELDSFVAAGLLNRLRGQGWQAEITAPSEGVTSMNGVRVQAQQPLDWTLLTVEKRTDSFSNSSFS